jgi:small subunit ribosomal protein S6e
MVVSDPEARTAQSVEIEENKTIPLIGQKIGDRIDGSLFGFQGKELQITGGSDKDGFPMRGNVHGGVRARVILSEGSGFRSKRKGGRKRKTLRGNIVTEEIVQLNVKIVKTERKRISKEKEKKTSGGTTEAT